MALSSKSFDVVNQKTRQQKGPLVRVELSPGRFVKMHREDAIAAGHIAPQGGEKMRPAAENKMLTAAEDKGVVPHPQPLYPPGTSSQGERGASEEEADFTSIPGVGPATARALKARRIETFEQLRAAGQLDFVSPQAMQAIEKWRAGG
jgi:predicted flap endonuclease-1-like 5' DNA nuclease